MKVNPKIFGVASIFALSLAMGMSTAAADTGTDAKSWGIAGGTNRAERRMDGGITSPDMSGLDEATRAELEAKREELEAEMEARHAEMEAKQNVQRAAWDALTSEQKSALYELNEKRLQAERDMIALYLEYGLMNAEEAAGALERIDAMSEQYQNGDVPAIGFGGKMEFRHELGDGEGMRISGSFPGLDIVNE